MAASTRGISGGGGGSSAQPHVISASATFILFVCLCLIVYQVVAAHAAADKKRREKVVSVVPKLGEAASTVATGKFTVTNALPETPTEGATFASLNPDVRDVLTIQPALVKLPHWNPLMLAPGTVASRAQRGFYDNGGGGETVGTDGGKPPVFENSNLVRMIEETMDNMLSKHRL